MKRTQPDIKWCKEHPEDIARWLRRRGEWDSGDKCVGITIQNADIVGVVHRHKTLDTEGTSLTGWAVSEVLSGILHWYCNKEKRIGESWCWLPSVGDMLGLLGPSIYEIIDAGDAQGEFLAYDSMGEVQGDGPTYLIALMELELLEETTNETMS